jgi:hypothetical protein
MLKRISAILFLIFGFIIFYSCEHEPIKRAPNTQLIDSTNSNNCNPDSVYFQNDVLPFIISNCAQAGCHDANSAADGVILDNYTNIIQTGKVVAGNPDKSEMFDEMKKGNMPPGGNLTSDQLNMIRKWILQGASNNRCNGGCDSTKFTYSLDIAPIIDKNCISCHVTSNIKIGDHVGLQTVALDGRLMGALNHEFGYQPMPSGSVFLNDCDLKKIRKWIDNGAPND